ncbi:hypothetical protein CRE_11434 [Caenorhabditis remanei]|uniref:F-box domain-containing protein n=1 Tax=Caenorhabditis remanei TaxID=31234 RepID=E3NBG5_CAERE|nr:hypothetical protein CRE_11434 [Caenorhabditis remanei]
MTDLPPNSPIDIRALTLYDIHQWKTTEKSYKNYEKLCKVLGNEAISYEEYEKWFNKYLEENYYSTRDGSSSLPIPDIRGCILSNVINGKSAKKSIDDLCDAFKYQKIDKEDHSFWYKRFRSGHFSQVTFSDFPEDVVAEIVGKCDIKSYSNLRSVSHGLRTVIDHLKPPCTDIKVYCGDTRINVSVDGALLADWDYYKPANRYLPMEQFVKRIPGPLKLFLSNPKLRLESFTFYTNSNYRATTYSFRKTVINLLNSLNHKIHVENCSIEMENTEDLIRILQCFKPRKLEKITLCDNLSLDMNQIINMDQWKQAKHHGLSVYGTVSPPRSNIFFIFQLLKDILSVSKSKNFAHIEVGVDYMFDTEEAKRVLNLQPTASPEVYSIPNSNVLIQLNDYGGLDSLKIYRK